MNLSRFIKLLPVLLYICLPNISADKQDATSNGCTTILPRLDVFKRHILSRRKRGIIFPKKAFVLISQAFTKAIIDGRPPGVSYSIEFDMYSPLPDTLEGWQPTILNNKLKNEQKLKTQKEAEAAIAPPTPLPPKTPLDAQSDADHMPPFTSAQDLDQFPLTHDVWPNDYEYPADFEYHNQDDPIMMTQQHWNTLYNVTRRQEQINYKQRQQYQHEMKNLYKKHTWKSSKSKQPKINPSEPSTYTPEEIHQWPPMEETYESADHVPIWKYHQAYRERRDLFEQMETLGKIFNFDMKSCIQRAMCEMRKNLKPYGESLMEDIVRIMLTIPTKLNFDDNYSFDFSQHSQKELNCADHFKRSCPYKVLDILTATLRTASLKDHQNDSDSGHSLGIVRSNSS